MDERDRDKVSDTADEPLHSDEGDLTPPQGDELRSEETFGRTDRYTNIDDTEAARQERFNRIDDREADNARMDVRRHEHSADSGFPQGALGVERVDRNPDPLYSSERTEPARGDRAQPRPAGDSVPVTNIGETVDASRKEITGRDGTTIVQDSVTMGRPEEGKEAADVDRRAP
ncbi:MAG TPA: hypothetical protein VL262_11005 [Vicinamibacterales bacterium]|jgi:hypothetical protein|nr:hypothetical protein [Vicinamibacterales bacterium]